MNARKLQLKRALNAALFVLLLSVAGSKNAFAQNTLVATLQHGEDISFFYGMNAFVNAHTAAESGDIITLSSGSFTPTTITKAITLRGAGFITDTISGTNPTTFSSEIVANVTDTVSYLTIEGINFLGNFKFGKLNNPHFNKCYFNWFFNNSTSASSSQMNNAQFLNCRFGCFVFLKFSSSASPVFATNTAFINCVVWNLGNGNNNYNGSYYYYIGSNSIVAQNSFFKLKDYPNAMVAENCIILGDNNMSYSLSGNSSANHCIGIRFGSSSTNPLGSSYTDCWIYNNGCGNVFESFNISSSYDSYTEPLILKEVVANTCLGTDGTQVGINGGVMPYSYRPAYMLIRHCNVARQSDNDNKLSVEIEAMNEGE